MFLSKNVYKKMFEYIELNYILLFYNFLHLVKHKLNSYGYYLFNN